MNVFQDGAADARQSDSSALTQEHSLFRKRYRQLSPDEVALHDAIKDKADELVTLFRAIPVHSGVEWDGEKHNNIVLGIRHLEDAVYRAVKALTA